MPAGLLALDPVPALLARLRDELSAEFDSAQLIRVSRAPGRLDVMGGIADYTGSLVVQSTLACGAAVALQARADRQVQVFSFNRFDDHQPFTFRVPLDVLAHTPLAQLRAAFAEPGRSWAAYLAGCLIVLHEAKLVDLADPAHRGLSLALHSTVPIGAGVSSSAAVEVATMINLVDHFGLRDQLDAMAVAALCQQVENRVVGAPCGIMDQAACCCGAAGSLLRMVCQPHELKPPLALPEGVRVLGIDSGVRHSVGGGAYGRTRCAAFMGHRIILERMREMGRASGREMTADPMNGYLANLDPDDYKNFFRPRVPEEITGQAFLDRYGKTIDPCTAVDPAVQYAVQHATDHHVLEARRVRRFAEFVEQASAEDGPRRKLSLDKAGHLMYASHLSYTNDAMLGHDACDLLVKLLRERECAGLYGARITGGGCGGTVAVLADEGARADAAFDEVMHLFHANTGTVATRLVGTSVGGWASGTVLITADDEDRR